MKALALPLVLSASLGAAPASVAQLLPQLPSSSERWLSCKNKGAQYPEILRIGDYSGTYYGSTVSTSEPNPAQIEKLPQGHLLFTYTAYETDTIGRKSTFRINRSDLSFDYTTDSKTEYGWRKVDLLQKGQCKVIPNPLKSSKFKI
jgi:hypothetical protein